jgi:hypothetical protein
VLKDLLVQEAFRVLLEPRVPRELKELKVVKVSKGPKER